MDGGRRTLSSAIWLSASHSWKTGPCNREAVLQDGPWLALGSECGCAGCRWWLRWQSQHVLCSLCSASTHGAALEVQGRHYVVQAAQVSVPVVSPFGLSLVFPLPFLMSFEAWRNYQGQKVFRS
jgi:LSD1 subclass zinc finger protein